jgi:hypothetical protein
MPARAGQSEHQQRRPDHATGQHGTGKPQPLVSRQLHVCSIMDEAPSTQAEAGTQVESWIARK